MILCDIGNTTYHFKNKKEYIKISVNENIQKLPNFENEKEIYFISVNNKASKKFLKRYPSAVDIKNIIDFKTNYNGMGIDRQVVCNYISNGIIVDVGSAITMDIMKEGKHKGGYIFPGFNAYKKIYPQISKKLSFHFENDVNLDKIPLETNKAINSAIIDSIIQPIIKQYNNFNLKIYITGGDGKLLMKYLSNLPVKYKKNLIFNSMKKIINKKRKETKC